MSSREQLYELAETVEDIQDELDKLGAMYQTDSSFAAAELALVDAIYSMQMLGEHIYEVQREWELKFGENKDKGSPQEYSEQLHHVFGEETVVVGVEVRAVGKPELDNYADKHGK